jgi:hypothetical protein
VSRLRLAILFGGALALIAGSAAGLRSRENRGAESPIPSVRNAAARGARALYTYLQESGAAPRILDRPYTELPDDARVLVALAPTRRRMGPLELAALRSFVERGNTFVYAAPRQVRKQAIDSWLELRWIFGPRPAPLLDAAQLDRGLKALFQPRPGPPDPTGALAELWLPSPLLEGVRSLRVAAEDGVETGVALSAPLAGAEGAPFVVELATGLGSVVLLAGSDLAENRRIALGDNVQLWANLAARGPIYFDEYHHAAPESGRGLAGAAGPLLLQLGLAGAALAVALGKRFGVPRPLSNRRGNPRAEYVIQLGELYARAGAEGELCLELHRSLRRRLFDRLGISAALDEPEAARRLQARTGIPAARVLALAERAKSAAERGADRNTFLELSREFALLERDAGCA